MAEQVFRSRFRTDGDGGAPWENSYSAGEQEASLGELLKRLSRDTGDLVGQEIALVKAQMRESVRQIEKGVANLAVAWMLGMTGLIAVTAALIAGIGGANGGHYGRWALIVGAVELIVAAIAANSARKSMRPREIEPTETLETLREDTAWARREAKDLKRDLTAPSTSAR